MEAALARSQPSPPGQWLEPIYRRHAAAVMHTAYRITGSAADAEDVLQTVFVRLARRADPPDLDRGAAAYLRRAATNAALDLVRSRSVRTATALESAPAAAAADPAPGPDRLHHGHELGRRLRRAIAGLSRRHAEIFVLRYLEGLDNPAIAALFDTTPASIAVTLHRTRERLADELAPYLGGSP
ncbi:MAG TPA: sigma-70 family RNA polymerase sigma factor [Thermoanaerobaculales bacterium]|nr:sigma-70 family RNA polymerase sigma factor [Thermoanaerobaculales bacterium]HPA79314.1 sigma-70 family RNA polymerase sigma factor [Thermoanaerobaculales bacterium]HQL31284.1 sigma-70 family RNA polymerase sigma factor [Thermoanaerobaculales bacterium]HQN96153.1 sigma-70 family RNA polymerase sigma factor [Thermoanaerobaculales bacterium]HQP42645.1 sigma-70 family RNA polymerase sigma factor [Thermoanaerobaculales bacterium]